MADGDYGVIFSGGGALGSWEVGCYRALQTRYNGRPPRIVTGASSGALNAVGVAAGMTPQQLAQLWGQLTNDGVYRANISTSDFIKLGFRSIFSSTAVTAFISRRRSYFDTGPLQATLLTILRNYWMSFAQSQTYCAISLTNLTTSRREFFYKLPPGQILPPPGNTATVWERLESLPMLVQTLMGSTALPILFPPHGIYFDGGVLLNQPISPAVHFGDPLGVRLYFVVIPAPVTLGATDNMLQIGSTLISTWLSASLLAQVETIKLRNYIRRVINQPNDMIRLCLIRPPDDLTQQFGVSLLSFGRRVPELVGAGEQAANDRLNLFDPDPGQETTWY